MENTKPFHDVAPNRGTVFLSAESYGAVRYEFRFLIILRCGSVRFCQRENHTVRCGPIKNIITPQHRSKVLGFEDPKA